jgi:protocatechuate 3,4-dioxygenase beta subunit
MSADDPTPDVHHHDEHDLGLAHDLPTLLNRRRALGLLSGVGLSAALAACGVLDWARDEPIGDAPSSGGIVPPDQTMPRSTSKVGKGDVPEETGGPFPADGSNGRNVLVQTGIVRSDITSSFGGPKGVATGVPTTLALTLLDHDDGRSKPLGGAAIYVWHCDSKGRYSMYHPHLAHQNYLRGLQVADRKGRVTFRTIFPAAYGGRWPHIHFEVFESQESATKTRGLLRTSQIALPEQACRQVYESTGYETSRANIDRTSLTSDIVFRDGHDQQLAKVTGSVKKGMRIALKIRV